MSIEAESRIPRILDHALAFEARSTHGFIKLSDWVGKGKWRVCSIEFIAFAEDADEFENLNVFPAIADLDHKVPQAYDIVHELVTDTAPVRAVFDIDPDGTTLYFSMQVVRNVDEPIRLFQALRTSGTYGVSCPADWRPGDAVLVPAPATLSDVANRIDRRRTRTQCNVVISDCPFR